jgi:leucine dehydrogenase
MKACAKAQFGSDSLAGIKVAVQGAGHVGQYLIKYLNDEGAKVFVTDIHKPTLKEVSEKFGSTIVGLDEIYDLDVDVYAPCALGATVNDETLKRLKCSIIAGAANNQLKKEDTHGQAVMDKGIIYAPDYMLNAGGVINCFAEVDERSAEWAMDKAAQIYDTTLEIINGSKMNNIPTYAIANKIAEDRIKGAL